MSIRRRIAEGVEREVARETIAFDKSEDRTRQEFKDESIMSELVDKWMKSERHTPRYESSNFGDFTAEVDFVAAFNAVEATKASFAQLPSRTRRFFDHDPGRLVGYLSGLTPEDVDEAVELGVLVREDAEVVASPPAVAPATAPPVNAPAEGDAG